MVKPILPPIASPSPSITSSSNTLIEQPITTSPTTSNAATKIANHPRTYKTQLSDPEREREEIERELGDFGGDIPDDKMLVRRLTARRNTLIGRGRTNSASVPGFPELNLIDSAYSDAHRALSRVYSSRINPTTGEIVIIAEEEVDPNKVQWLEDDPENPQNWSYRYKWFVTAICSFLTLNVTFASTAPTAATVQIAEAFNVSIEASLLVTSLFLSVGYTVGVIAWAGLSESIGRRPVFIFTMACYALLQIGEALAPNFATILVCRALAGIFASAPLSNAGGVIADTWDILGRGPAMSVFTLAVFLGPIAGPIIGGYLVDSYLGFRWIFWIMLIWASLALAVVVIFLPETYSPVLLAKRAKKMRKEEPEKNANVWADLERADFTFMSILRRTVFRPFIMLAKEPILLLSTIYLSVVYGLLYGLFSVYPIIWTELYGFSDGETGLVFLGVGIGSFIGAALNIYLQRHYKELVVKWHQVPPPEERLWGACVAGPVLVVAIFGLGWTGQYPNSIPWWVPALFTVGIGAALVLVFISLLSYTIECYLMYAASALSANTIVRSLIGGIVPLFINQMFATLGIGGACSLIGGIAILITPVPFLFFKYGVALRTKSTFAPCLDIHMIETVRREEREALEKTEGVSV